MSLSDKTAALVQSMQGIGTLITQQFAKKVALAAEADSTTTVGGKTPSQLATALDAELTTHASSPGSGHVKLADINVFSKTELAGVIGTRYPLAQLPVSRYGELSYLPVGVSGSFEGASTFFGKVANEARNYPGIVEDDGTYVFLRNGTTGSKFGVYYAYVKNILSTSDMTPVRTNRKYAPAYFPANTSAGYVARGDVQGQCIFGRLQDTSNNYGAWFLSLTHGTFDDSKHTGCIIAASSFPSQVNNCYPEAFVGLNAVYFLFPVYDTSGGAGPATNPVEWAVYTVPLSSIGNGNTVTPTQITGWTCTSFNGATISSTNLRLADKAASNSNADNPMVLVDSSAWGVVNIVPFYPNELGQNTNSAQNTDGTCRSRQASEFVVWNPNTGEQPVWNSYFSFTWNPNTKTAAIEPAYRSVGTVALSGGKIVLGGGSLLADRRPYSIANFLTGETMIYHPQGWWVSVVDQAVVDYPCFVGRAKLTAGAIGAYAALAGNTTTSNWATVQYNAAYGSAVGGGLMGSTQLPGNKMLVFGSGRNAAGNYARDVMLVQKGADGYTYPSLFFGSLTGFAPNAGRQFLTDLGLTPLNYASIISEINSAGAVTCTGAQFMEGIKDSSFLSCDANLNLSGTTAIAPALYAAVRNAVMASAGVSGPNGAYCTIVVPQNASIPPWAVVDFIDAAKTQRIILAELSITAGARNGTISGLSVVSISGVFAMQNFVNTYIPNQQNYAYTYMGGGVTVYETSDCWIIGGQTKHFIDRVTNTGTASYRFVVPKSSLRPTWSSAWVGPYWTTFESYFFGGVPGKGFGQFSQTNTGSDGTTKLVFRPVATNLAGYNAWTEQAQANWSVQTSQDVASGWLVYFTQQSPLILNGQRYTLPPVTIDLTTIQANPANTTFYVYAVVRNGVASYLVSATQQAEAMDTMYIGKVVTNATIIASMTLEKVTRLGTYRFSNTARGSAMTVSNGLPSQTSTAAWT